MRPIFMRTHRPFSSLLLASALLFANAAWAEPTAPLVTDVTVSSGANEMGAVVVQLTGVPTYSARLDQEAKRLVIDLSDAEIKGAPPALDRPKGVVGGVTTQTFKQQGRSVTRISISLLEAARYGVSVDGNSLRVRFEKGPFGAISSRDSGLSRKSPAKRTEAMVADIRFEHKTSRDVVEVELDSRSHFRVENNPGGVSRLLLRGARLPQPLVRKMDVAGYGGDVHAVASFTQGGEVVIEAHREMGLTSSVERRGNVLVWSFYEPGTLHSSLTGLGRDGLPARQSRTVSTESSMDTLPEIHSGIDGLLDATTAESDEAGAFGPNVLGQARGYTGRRIDLDLKDADIHNVLRLIGDVSRRNIVVADDVSGTVTIRLRNVPWDQALAVILQSKKLGMVEQGNLLRIAPLDVLQKEREQEVERRKMEVELAPIETRLIPVSYASAADLEQRLQPLLSERGSISIDGRTNTLIARDVSAALNQVEELARALDTQTPQVLVEARIIEATSSYIRDVGIQWGGSGTMSSTTGNPTGLAFPSAIGVAGGASDAQTPTQGLSPFSPSVANPNFAINMPAAVGTGQGGAIGLTFGSIDNNVNLALRLSAAESSGMLRILSSPRVLTMDNKPAKISQGTMIPFSQVSAQGVQTVFQEATLELQVTPHVTADGSVQMAVRISRDEPDFNQTSARGDPTILKRQAETQLLVMDGHTAVIGGIFVRNTGRNVDQVPFFGDIPILGLLFQRRRASDTRGELVIFITPRIVNRAEALGR